MTDDRSDRGFEVAPQPLGGGSGGPGPGRGRLAGIAIVVAVGTGLVLVGWLGPRLDQRPSFETAFFSTPSPSRTSAPDVTPGAPSARPSYQSSATPKPGLAIAPGPGLAGFAGVWTSGFQVLDLADGTLSAPVTASNGVDAVVATPDGNWLCICMTDLGNGIGSAIREVSLVRVRPDGSAIDRRTLATIEGTTDAADDAPYATDVDVAPDGRSALIAITRRGSTDWQVELRRADLVDPGAGPVQVLGRQSIPGVVPDANAASGAPPQDLSTGLFGPSIRRSPDGRSAFIWSTLARYENGSLTNVETAGWRVSLDGEGAPTAITPAPGLDKLRPACGSSGFIGDDRFLAVCTDFTPPNATDPPRPTWSLVELDATGQLVGERVLPPADGSPSGFWTGPVFDTANGMAWLWDPTGPTLFRIDADGLAITTRTFEATDMTAPGFEVPLAHQPALSRPGSSVSRTIGSQLAGSPGSGRLYGVGFGAGCCDSTAMPESFGVFVLDPRTMALVDRWAPHALYTMVEPVAGGRAVAAVGSPRFDTTGATAPWNASITIHDATDGHVLLTLSQFGDGVTPIVTGG